MIVEVTTANAPGDILVYAEAMRYISGLYPDVKWVLRCTYPELLQNHPVVSTVSVEDPDASLVLSATKIRPLTRSRNYVEETAAHLCGRLKLEYQPTSLFNRLYPRIWFQPDDSIELPDQYVVVNMSYKRDIPTKWLGKRFWEEFLSALPCQVVRIGRAPDSMHFVPDISGDYINLVGATNFAQLAGVLKRARAVITPPSFPLHLAVAVEAPVLLLTGGREPSGWYAFPGVVSTEIYPPECETPCWVTDNCPRTVDGVSACLANLSPAYIAQVIEHFYL